MFFIPDRLTIEGGSPVRGSIEISGAKNAILGLMAAALLTDEKVTLHNVPYISDVLDMGHIMRELGVDVKFNPEKKILKLHAKKIKSNILSEKAIKFRASYYLWGSLLARFRHTKEFDCLKVRIPGGCSFGGKRATDFHEKLLRTVFNCNIQEETLKEKPHLCFYLPAKEPENSCPIYTTAKVSHGATFHWLLSVAGSKNLKMMYNSSLEPEVSNLVDMLQKMGLSVHGSGQTGLIYNGGNKGLLKGGDFIVIPDRLEAASYALLALGTGGFITLCGINYEHCSPWLSQLKNLGSSGIYYSEDKNEIILDFREREKFSGVTMQMSPFPGMETDIHQVWTPILALAESKSTIVDIIWPGRIGHLEEMQKFGLKTSVKQIDVDAGQGITYQAMVAEITPSELHPASAVGMDLRGTMGLIVLAAMVKGKSTIEKPMFALRGYPNLITNLQSLGVKVKTSPAGINIESLPHAKV